MVDVDTFLTALHVMMDDFCQSHRPKRQPGPKPSLSESKLITLAIFARWSRFSSERDFYRYATGHLRSWNFPFRLISNPGLGQDGGKPKVLGR